MNGNGKRKFVYIFTVICILAAVLILGYEHLYPVYLGYKFHIDISDASSIGIIGGADGPTSIYIAKRGLGLYKYILKLPAVFSVIGIVYLSVTNRKRNDDI